MSTILEVSPPDEEPITIEEAIAFLKLPSTTPDASSPTAAPLLATLISAARRYIESLSGWTLASRDFVQYEDGFFPYFVFQTESIFGPIASYPYSYPYPYANVTSAGKRLMRGPVTDVSKITYLAPDGTPVDLTPEKDFVVDLANNPGRVGPFAGKVWPNSLYGINTVQIFFTAGYHADPNATMDKTFQTNTPPNAIANYKATIGIPYEFKMAILLMLSHYYFNRDAVVAGTATDVPHGVTAILQSCRMLDFGPAPQ